MKTTLSITRQDCTAKGARWGQGLLALCLLAPLAAFGHGHDQDIATRLKAAGQVIPLQQVLDQVAKDYPGQVLRVELEDDDDACEGKDRSPPCEPRWVYELKILQSEGRVIKLEIDARNGQVVKMRQRDAEGRR
ncbi:MAG TPA: PepSY domain-containing protein [Castellaniella sp.]|nr:PepSY domain-containing protein [Castellaniella sp.]